MISKPPPSILEVPGPWVGVIAPTLGPLESWKDFQFLEETGTRVLSLRDLSPVQGRVLPGREQAPESRWGLLIPTSPPPPPSKSSALQQNNPFGPLEHFWVKGRTAIVYPLCRGGCRGWGKLVLGGTSAAILLPPSILPTPGMVGAFQGPKVHSSLAGAHEGAVHKEQGNQPTPEGGHPMDLLPGGHTHPCRLGRKNKKPGCLDTVWGPPNLLNFTLVTQMWPVSQLLGRQAHGGKRQSEVVADPRDGWVGSPRRLWPWWVGLMAMRAFPTSSEASAPGDTSGPF